MEDDTARLIDEANRIALRVGRAEYRKAMGLAYIYWSSLSIAYFILFAAVYEFNIKALMSGIASGVATAIIGVLYVIVFIEVVLRRFKRIPRIKGSSARKSYYYYVPFIAMVVAFDLVVSIINNTIVYAALSALFAFIVVFFYVYKPMIAYGVRPRYYDYTAWIVYVISMPIGPLYYIAYYAAMAAWMFAGMASLLEVIEGG